MHPLKWLPVKMLINQKVANWHAFGYIPDTEQDREREVSWENFCVAWW